MFIKSKLSVLNMPKDLFTKSISRQKKRKFKVFPQSIKSLKEKHIIKGLLDKNSLKNEEENTTNLKCFLKVY